MTQANPAHRSLEPQGHRCWPRRPALQKKIAGEALPAERVAAVPSGYRFRENEIETPTRLSYPGPPQAMSDLRVQFREHRVRVGTSAALSQTLSSCLIILGEAMEECAVHSSRGGNLLEQRSLEPADLLVAVLTVAYKRLVQGKTSAHRGRQEGDPPVVHPAGRD